MENLPLNATLLPNNVSTPSHGIFDPNGRLKCHLRMKKNHWWQNPTIRCIRVTTGRRLDWGHIVAAVFKAEMEEDETCDDFFVVPPIIVFFFIPITLRLFARQISVQYLDNFLWGRIEMSSFLLLCRRWMVNIRPNGRSNRLQYEIGI